MNVLPLYLYTLMRLKVISKHQLSIACKGNLRDSEGGVSVGLGEGKGSVVDCEHLKVPVGVASSQSAFICSHSHREDGKQFIRGEISMRTFIAKVQSRGVHLGVEFGSPHEDLDGSGEPNV